MNFFGRVVVFTTLDPVPRLLRTLPGCIALNQREVQELADGDEQLFKDLVEILKADDAYWAKRSIRHLSRQQPQSVRDRMSQLQVLLTSKVKYIKGDYARP